MLIIDMPIGADLVDRAVLYERLKQWQDAVYDTLTLSFLHEVKMLIGSAPHVKAVELVRCGECKHWEEESTFCLNKDGCYGSETPDDWFCADGERKDGSV